MQLSPQSIRTLCRKSEDHEPLISPFIERTVHKETGMSGGLSCAGYDVHLADVKAVIVDGQKAFHEPYRISSAYGDDIMWTIPPHTGVLGVTNERFCIPNNLALHYFNKSTLARKFINAAATLAEPGWHGYLTLELYNNSDNFISLYQRQPIGQVVFMMLDAPSENPYSGKYQGQEAAPVQAKREE